MSMFLLMIDTAGIILCRHRPYSVALHLEPPTRFDSGVGENILTRLNCEQRVRMTFLCARR